MGTFPEEDAAFFNEIREVFLRYPDAQPKYAISSLALENELGVDFSKQIGVRQIDGDRIITEFRDRQDGEARSRYCLQWGKDGEVCLVRREEM